MRSRDGVWQFDCLETLSALRQDRVYCDLRLGQSYITQTCCWTSSYIKQHNGDELPKRRTNGPGPIADIGSLAIVTISRLGWRSERHKPQLHVLYPAIDTSPH